MSNQDRPTPLPPAFWRLRAPEVAEKLLTLLVLALLAFDFIGLSTGHRRQSLTGWDLTPLPQLLLAAAAVLTVTRRRHPVALVAIGAACWLFAGGDPAVIALGFYNLGLHPPAPPRHTSVIAAAALAAMTCRALFQPVLNTVFYTLAAGALPLAVGLWLAARRTLLANLRRQLFLSREVRERDIAAARTAERSRIAGEMHDVVAHKVSLMVVHAGALEVSSTDPAVIEPASLIRESGREALQELRTVLGLLHAQQDAALTPQPTLEQLHELIASSRQAGVKIHLTVEGTPRELSATVERTAYRIAQEALTNIHKHAPGARATVRVRHDDGVLGISIRNTRPTRPPAEDFPRGGHGLLGLAERVGLLGGTFTAEEQSDGGFLINATIPMAHHAETQQHRTAA
ncbi:sensor histidine kinase [Streptomyces sp. NPDC056519]|uniref:sensor histidine kinase n=1 Tax=Streptomyces sp. NPDC056519 TaxID=3345849 RepID=UPI0036BCC1B0